MPEPEGQVPTGQGQEPAAVSPSTQPPPAPAPAPAAAATPPPTGQEPAGEEKYDAAYVKKLREEAAAARTKLREQESRTTELEAKVKTFEDAQLSEQERTAKRLEEAEKKAAEAERKALDAETQRQQTQTRAAIEAEAAKLGIVDPEAAYRLVDLAALTFDDDGKPKNARDALTELVKTKTYLIGGSTASPTNPPRSGQSVTETEAEQRRRIYGSGGTFWDVNRARERGGGVVIHK